MPTDAEIEAAAGSLWKGLSFGSREDYLREAEAALIAAEKVREPKHPGPHVGDPCVYCGEARTHSVDEVMVTEGLLDQSVLDEARTQPETGHEWTTDDGDAECRKCGKWKPETGQPASNYSPQLARRDDQFFRQGVASERRRIVALIEGLAMEGDPVATYNDGLWDAVTAIQEDTDE